MKKVLYCLELHFKFFSINTKGIFNNYIRSIFRYRRVRYFPFHSICHVHLILIQIFIALSWKTIKLELICVRRLCQYRDSINEWHWGLCELMCDQWQQRSFKFLACISISLNSFFLHRIARLISNRVFFYFFYFDCHLLFIYLFFMRILSFSEPGSEINSTVKFRKQKIKYTWNKTNFYSLVKGFYD